MADDNKIALMLEAEKRGILPPDKAPLLAEARKRGLIPGDVPKPPDEASDTKIGKTLGDRLKARVAQFREAATPGPGTSAPEQALGMAANVAGGLWDIASPVVDPIISNISKLASDRSGGPEWTKRERQQTPAGKAVTSTVQDMIQRLHEQAKAHPRLARDLGWGVDVASVFPMGRGAQKAGEVAGGAMLGTSEELAARAAKQESERLLNTTKLRLDAMKPKQKEAISKKLGGTTIEGESWLSSGTEVAATTAKDKEVEAAVKGIVDPKASFPKNRDAVMTKIGELAEKTEDLPKEFDKAYEDRLAQEAEQAAGQAAAQPSVFEARVVPAPDTNGFYVQIGERPNGSPIYRRSNGIDAYYLGDRREQAESMARRATEDARAAAGPGKAATPTPRRNMRTALTDVINKAKAKAMEEFTVNEEEEAKAIKQGVLDPNTAIAAKYNKVRDLYMANLNRLPNTLGSVLQARKNLDAAIKAHFPNLWTPAYQDSTLKRAAEDIRRSANDFVAEQLPEGNEFKALLDKQTHLYTARDNMYANHAKDASLHLGVAQKVWGAIKKHPYLSAEAARTLGSGAAIGIGGAFAKAVTSPSTLAILATYGSVQIGKMVLHSPKVAKLLSDVLKVSGKALAGEEREAIQRQIKLLNAGTMIGTGAAMNKGAEAARDNANP